MWKAGIYLGSYAGFPVQDDVHQDCLLLRRSIWVCEENEESPVPQIDAEVDQDPSFGERNIRNLSQSRLFDLIVHWER